MHPRYLAERNQTAENRIKAAARQLAQGEDLDPLITRMETAHDPDLLVKQLLQREALADLMDAVAQKTYEPPKPASVRPVGRPARV